MIDSISAGTILIKFTSAEALWVTALQNSLFQVRCWLTFLGRCRARQTLYPRRVGQRHQTATRCRTLSNRNLRQTERS